MNTNIRKINQAILPLRDQIINHRIYSTICELSDLRVFMQHHVFAAWDYMSLLASVHNNLKQYGDSITMIEKMVELEQNDLDLNGEVKSHFTMYLDSMRQAGTDLSQIECFIRIVQEGSSLEKASHQSELPESIISFLENTRRVRSQESLATQMAVLVFTREDLIPSMFVTLINELHDRLPDQVSYFKHYLKKHIEIDGNDRKKFLFDMVAKLCGSNDLMWKKAENEVVNSLNMRLSLLDEAYESIVNHKLNDYYGFEIDYSATLYAIATG